MRKTAKRDIEARRAANRPPPPKLPQPGAPPPKPTIKFDYYDIEVVLDDDFEEVRPKKSPRKTTKPAAASQRAEGYAIEPHREVYGEVRDVVRAEDQPQEALPSTRGERSASELGNAPKGSHCTVPISGVCEDTLPTADEGSGSGIEHASRICVADVPLEQEGFTQPSDNGSTDPEGQATDSTGPSWLQSLAKRIASPLQSTAAEMPLRPSLLMIQRQLEQMLSAVIDSPGQNASVILKGPVGVGKSLVLQRAIGNLEAKYNTEPTAPRMGIVRLTGILHAEERAAFREIARQLCSLFGIQFSDGAAADENQSFLRDILRETSRSQRAVVFVLDDWDAFARRPKQKLLYDLLDAMQTPKVQAAVVGLSCSWDADQLLEKRLASRFSARSLVVASPATGAEDPEEAPAAMLRAHLRVHGTASAAGHEMQDGFAAECNGALEAALKAPAVETALQSLSDRGLASPGDLQQIAHVALMYMAADGGLLTPKHFLAAFPTNEPGTQHMVEAVAGLSVLEMYMLVALERLSRRRGAALNFEATFDEYSSLRRGGSYRGCDETAPRHAALRAFQHLLDVALVSCADARCTRQWRPREAVLVDIAPTELSAGLRANGQTPPFLVEWLSRVTVAVPAAGD